MANRYKQRRRQLRQTQVKSYDSYDSLAETSGGQWPSPPVADVDLPPRGQVQFMIALALIVAVLLVYAQTAQHDFTVCDDNVYVYENPEIQQGLTRPLVDPNDGLFVRGAGGALTWVRWEGIYWAFSESHAGNWHPLTWLTHMIDWQIYGHWNHEQQKYVNSWPGGHHVTNMFIHAMNTLLLFFALRNFTGTQWASAAVAMLFAVHPLRAESVAWAAERKDVLCGFFWTLTMMFYAKYARRPSLAWYLAATVTLFFGLMAKSMIVTLPCVLLLLDFWPLNRITGQFVPDDDEESALTQIGWLCLEKLPWLAVVVGVSYETILGQHKGVALNSFDALPTWMRLVNMSLAYVAYVWQSLWPTQMAPFYTHLGMIPSGEMHHSMTLDVVLEACLAAAVLLAITTATIGLARRYAWLAVGWLWFLGALVPVIGILQVGTQSRADRYTYLPTIGLAIMLVWGVRAVVDRVPALRTMLGPCVALVTALLISIAWLQVSYWKTSYTLFEHAAQVTERNFFAYNHLGIAYDKDSKDMAYTLTPRHRAEFDHFGIPYDKSNADESLRITAEQRSALADLSAESFANTLKIKPDYDFGNNNLGVYYANKHDVGNAEKYFLQALRCNNRYADVYNNLGSIYRGEAERMMDQGNAQAANEFLAKSLDMHLHGLQVRQDKASDFHNTAETYLDMEQFAKAIEMLNFAIRLDPSFFASHLRLAEAYLKQHNAEQAEQYLRQAKTINPNAIYVWCEWALRDINKRDLALARAAAEEALKLVPNFLPAYTVLGNIALREKKYDEAIAHISKAAQLDPHNPAYPHSIEAIKAIQSHDASLKINPDNVPSHLAIAQLFISIGLFDEAIGHLKKATSLDPANLAARHQLGLAYLGKGDPDTAMTVAKKIVKDAPKYGGGHALMGQIHIRNKELPEAVSEYRAAIDLEPKNAIYHHLLGLLLWEMGRRGDAIAEIEKAMQFDAGNAEEAALLARMRKESAPGTDESMKHYRVGIIGYGMIGKVHAYGYAALPFCCDPLPLAAQITHVVTARQETAQRAAQLLGAAVAATDFRAITEDADVDIVHICTPNDQHCAALISAMAGHKHIYCDKPLTATLSEAEQIEASLGSYRGVAQMTLQNRFFPATLRARQLVEAGFLGKLLAFRALYLHAGSASPQAPARWKLMASTGGGVIADLGPHLFDLVEHLAAPVAGPICSVLAHTQIAFAERPAPGEPAKLLSIDAEDSVVALVKLRSGVTGTIEASKIALGAEDELRIELHGTSGALRFNTMEPHYLDLFDGSESDRPCGGTRGWKRVAAGQRYERPDSDFPTPKAAIGWVRSHVACLAHFLQAVAHNTPAEPGLARGVRLQRLLDATARSARERRWIDV